MMGQYLMDIKNGKNIPSDFINAELLKASHRTEPTIHNLLRNMKSQFEFSFHQQLQSHQHQQTDQVLDLSSKRRDSTETRKTTSPSSYEEGSPDMRKSPQLLHHQLLLHSALNIPKPSFTPEHTIQYYNYDQTSPTSTKPAKLYERFECKQDNRISEQPKNSVSPPTFYHSTVDPHHHHEDSNDVPAANISSSSSTTSSQKSPSSNPPMIVGRDGKLSRPFKAYPRDPLSLAAAGSFLDANSAEKYSVFRKRMLDQIHAANGGNPVVNNPKMRRMNVKGATETNNNISETSYDSCSEKSESQQKKDGSNGDKDEAYFERRRKNNAAAKKSRDRRRIKEDEIAIRAAFLERENIELKFELAAARKQLAMFNQGIAAAN